MRHLTVKAKPLDIPGGIVRIEFASSTKVIASTSRYILIEYFFNKEELEICREIKEKLRLLTGLDFTEEFI